MAERCLLYHAPFRSRKSERAAQFRGPRRNSLAMRLDAKVTSCIGRPMWAMFHMTSYRPKPCDFSVSDGPIRIAEKKKRELNEKLAES